MNTERMIKELRNISEARKYDRVHTGQINWSNLCYDVANKLEELNNEVKRLTRVLASQGYQHTESRGYNSTPPVGSDAKDA